jgi:hypothetical protein
MEVLLRRVGAGRLTFDREVVFGVLLEELLEGR